MSRVDDIVGLVTGHSRIAIVVMLVLTVAIGSGAPMVEQTSSLDQFQSDTPEAEATEYIEGNFSTGPENTTFVQVIVRGDNVLSKESLLSTLKYQQRLRDNETVGATLASDQSTVGVANVIAIGSLSQEIGGELQRTAAEFERLNATVTAEREALQRNATALQQRQTELNQTTAALQGALTTLAENPDANVSTTFAETNAETPVELTDEDFGVFRQATQQLRNASSEQERQQAFELGTRGVLGDEFTALQERSATLQEQRTALEAKGERLRELGEQLQTLQSDLEDARSASLDRQIQQLESMNASQLDATIETVLGGGSGQGSERALGFMPIQGYEPGSTTANATMVLITQQTDTPSVGGGTATQTITDSQLAMQDLAKSESNGLEFLVFGSGIITDEINQSMTDSMTIVGPMAMLFVLIALALGYRDILDIALGLIGILAVLIWTFGFMGWLDIDFNQIFIAVPVLLIGLSIDYAIHIFMRHREERLEHEGNGLRGSMRIALGGVGVALALVTATTVIGFLSNLTSPLPPIQDFGVVSSFGITAAFLIFGVLTPALKVEIDGFLENRGFDRKKRAIGTGGGPLGEALKIGSLGAKKAPYVVLVLALLVSAGGVYGATQVDTSFEQSDFLAEDPPGWMQELPEPFAPADYSAKENLEFVNERFRRADSEASILIRGNLATVGALEQLEAAQSSAAEKDVTQRLPTGEASLQTPLTVMRDVAGQNETFNATFTAADTDGDGLPDQNVESVYDSLFATAPQEAGQVLSQNDDGDYDAARFVVSIKGTASGSDTTEQMRAVATQAEGSGLAAIATGQAILFEIVQKQLLDTVVQSLLITLVAVIAFLMVVYRITDGSATLGFVTLIPVVLSVAWILGTMFLLDIPFNVLTGMITSLTVGLGVAYSIHLSERYNQELDRNASAWVALDKAVTGTGGALLGSAATTIGGFGTLAFALLPSLQQFGIITGLTIIYAFLASVLVLPSLLYVWTRFIGPAEKLTPRASPEAQAESTPTDD